MNDIGQWHENYRAQESIKPRRNRLNSARRSSLDSREERLRKSDATNVAARLFCFTVHSVVESFDFHRVSKSNDRKLPVTEAPINGAYNIRHGSLTANQWSVQELVETSAGTVKKAMATGRSRFDGESSHQCRFKVIGLPSEHS